MTNQPHPITPPIELVAQWLKQFYGSAHGPATKLGTLAPGEASLHVATAAAQWGADQELEACCGFIGCEHSVAWSSKLRTARRPKPPSLKEQALEALGRFNTNAHTTAHQMKNDFDLFRRALEALND